MHYYYSFSNKEEEYDIKNKSNVLWIQRYLHLPLRKNTQDDNEYTYIYIYIYNIDAPSMSTTGRCFVILLLSIDAIWFTEYIICTNL